MEKHFCTCTDTACPKHPGNHSHGCDPCIKSNLLQKRMPACFYNAVHEDVSGVTDFTIEGFVDFFQIHREEYLRNKKQRKNW